MKWLIGTILFFSMNVFSSTTTITFCFENANYPPYLSSATDNLDNPDGYTGLLIDLVNKAAKKSNVNAQFIAMPWLRCQNLVRKNKANALFAIIQTDIRERLFQFPIKRNNKQFHLMNSEYSLFIKKGSILDMKSKELVNSEGLNLAFYKQHAKYGLAAPLGYVVTQLLSDNNVLAPHEVNAEEGLQLVASEQLDGYVIDRLIGEGIIDLLNLTSLVRSTKHPVLTKVWHVAFNKNFYHNNRDLVDRFWFYLDQSRQQLNEK